MTPGTVASQTENPSSAAEVYLGSALRFSIAGDLRYISHRDELRMLARALTRAAWPLAYSRGFNPQPRLVLPLPRSVGTASACEWALVRLSEPRSPEWLYRSLATALPSDCTLQSVTALPKRLTPHPLRVSYRIELDREDAGHAAPRIAALLATERVMVERTQGPGEPARPLDIRPYIETVILDGRSLSMWLVFVDQLTARPTEVLTALHLPATAYNHRVLRVEVDWDVELAGPTGWPASTERNNVDQEEERSAPRQAERKT